MSLTPFLILWSLLAVAVVTLIVWRKAVASKEDDNLHVLEGEFQQTTQQVVVAKKLEKIDKWGKLLTVIAVVYGAVLGVFYVYQSWVHNV